jgi:uncharacterized membrane protein HdeD (DUF308 family)
MLSFARSHVMISDRNAGTDPVIESDETGAPFRTLRQEIRHEFEHLRSHWWWFLVLGGILVACGTAAVVVPAATAAASLIAVLFLGVSLMLGGIVTIVSAFWVGRSSGFLVQLLVGLIYLAAGFVVTDHPAVSTVMMTLFVSVSFIVLGAFRTMGALLIRYPQWGWSLVNGIITTLAGIVIYRHLPEDALWVIGLLVGVEMLFNGWSWIMLGLAIRNLPQPTA